MKTKCEHKRLSYEVQCVDCDATWSDPRRATEALLDYMRRSPALKHNIQEIAHELFVESIYKPLEKANKEYDEGKLDKKDST